VTPVGTTRSNFPEARLSRAISIARILCLLGIVYVHAWTGLTGEQLGALSNSGQGMLRWTLMELLGRSAVPLLGIVSGWLLAAGTRRRAYRPFLARKARAILTPMILWNALSILIVSGAGYAGIIQAPGVRSLWWLLDELFCLATPNDINVQTAFLRDLFLCLAAAPLLLRAPTPLLLVIVALTVVWSVSGWTFPLLLRPAIASFFVLGILIRRGDLALRLATVAPLLAVAPVLLLAALKIALETQVWGVARELPAAVPIVDLLLRPAVALLFWRVAWALAGGASASRWVVLDRYVFFVFCAHLILIWLGGPLIGRVTGPLGSPAYPLYLVLQPVLVAGAGIALARMLEAAAPDAAHLLSGGRLGRPAASGAGRRTALSENCRTA
jgi:hypothetical protein